MKNSIRTTFILLIGTSLFVSCSKSGGSGTSTPTGPVNGLVASYTQAATTGGTTTTTVYTFTYDSQNRLIERDVTNQSPATYVYGSGTVTETQGTNVTVYTLNSAGLATSDNQGNAYTYDSNGYLTNETNSTTGASTTNTVSDGNIVSSVQTSGGVTLNISYTFLSGTNFATTGQSFLGAADANLIQYETIKDSFGTFTYPFTYTYDSEGRKQTEKIVEGSTTYVITFTYVS